jgi:hypothetical protein
LPNIAIKIATIIIIPRITRMIIRIIIPISDSPDSSVYCCSSFTVNVSRLYQA